jgi:salicylate hydroxylase
MSTGSQPDVIVVGGGIGGLAAATGLSRKGLTVRVLEQAPEFGEVGAGIQIAPNCTRILDSYGLLAEAKKLGVLVENMVMKDALDGRVLTTLDLLDMEKRYGTPYMVIHRSDLHGLFLKAAREIGVGLRTNQKVTSFENTAGGARVTVADGSPHEARVVIAADGLHSVARKLLTDDEPVNSAYVAYRGAVPIEKVRQNNISEQDVVVYVGPHCHFVQYPLRGGDVFNQVAVFESPKALRGEEDWGTPDELDAAFAHTCENVQRGLPLMWRDRWWRMFDRNPISTWVHGNIALLGDAAHPPLQYIAQGAIMAIEDGYVLAEHAAAHKSADGTVDWDATLKAYEAVRSEHCRRVVLTSRAWGELWHLDGDKRERRNELLRARDTLDYGFVDWLYERTALTPDEEPEMFTPVPLDSAAPSGITPASTAPFGNVPASTGPAE